MLALIGIAAEHIEEPPLFDGAASVAPPPPGPTTDTAMNGFFSLPGPLPPHFLANSAGLPRKRHQRSEISSRELMGAAAFM